MRYIVALLVLVTALHLVPSDRAWSSGFSCPNGLDACILVNSTSDVDARDSELTLREAIRIASGDLGIGSLAAAEAAAVHVESSAGLAGEVGIYLDAAVFNLSSSPEIELTAGLGNLDTPPGHGSPGSEPGSVRIGFVLDSSTGVEVPLGLTLVGAAVPNGIPGLTIARDAWIRGIHFEGFAGNEIVIEGEADVLIGTDGDQVNDEAEAVTFDPRAE